MNRQPTPPKRPAAPRPADVKSAPVEGMVPPVQSAQPEGRLTQERLLSWLLADKLIGLQQVEQLRVSQPGRGEDTRHPLIRIGEQGWVSATHPPFPLSLERLTRWLAEKVGLPYVRIDPLKIDVEAVTKLVSQAYAQRFRFLPIEVDAENVTVATAEPYLREWELELSRILQRKIRRVIANPKDINRYLTEFYGVSRSIFGATRASTEGSVVTNFESLTELGQVGEPDANDQHIVHLVDWLLQFAFEQRASDIHVEPRRELSRIRFRIDGMLHQVHELPTPIVTAITSRLKSLGRMDVADKRRPQDGRVKTKTPAGKEVEMRLSTMPTTFGEKLVLRIFDPQVLSRSFAELGFGDHDLACWQRMVENPHGFILVTGPARCATRPPYWSGASCARSAPRKSPPASPRWRRSAPSSPRRNPDRLLQNYCARHDFVARGPEILIYCRVNSGFLAPRAAYCLRSLRFARITLPFSKTRDSDEQIRNPDFRPRFSGKHSKSKERKNPAWP